VSDSSSAISGDNPWQHDFHGEHFSMGWQCGRGIAAWCCAAAKHPLRRRRRRDGIPEVNLSRRLDTSRCNMHNGCMTLIQVRDVPEEVRDELARRAALSGKSLQSYLLGELTKLSERPSMAEIIERAQARAKATGSTVTMPDAVAAVRAGRDRYES
jgi:antitoxin FitA